jgi:Transmembrane secretion effector
MGRLPARFAVLPGVVPDHHPEAGNALLNLNQQGSFVVGPALAGVLIATTSTGAAFATDAAAFALATALLLLIAVKPRPADDQGPGDGSRGLLREIVDGLAYTWNDVGLRSVIVLIAVVDFWFAGAMEVGLPAPDAASMLPKAAAPWPNRC